MSAHRQTPWRKDPAILARLQQVEPLVLEGQHNTAIAAALGVSEATIRSDRKRLQELWLEAVGGDVRARRAARIAQLEDLARHALHAALFDERMERAVLLGEPIDGVQVYRDHKGSAQFRGNKAGALQAARQALMDAAKVEGLVVDKLSPTDDRGRTLDLASLMALARQQGTEDGDGNAAG